MATSCEICGGSTSARGTYRALDDAGQTVRDFPAVECAKCGHVFPDADQIGEMRPSQVPSSVRIRCARRVPADLEGEWPGQVRGLGHGGQTTSPVSASMRDASGREAVGHTVLVVEDDIAARGALERVLFAAGYRVSVARDGPDATESVMVRSFDVIISGEFVRETSGITLLRAIRSRDLDVPVLLLTEAPSPETAAMAEALGATGYLTKPLRGADLISSVEHARTLGTLMKAKRDALALGTRTEGTIVRRSGLDVTLARALAATRIATQPIVDPRQWHVFAQEVVVGSDEPMMATSAQLFEAAERLGRLRELGRAVRSLAAESPATDGAKLFVRLHASDLTDEDSVLAKRSAIQDREARRSGGRRGCAARGHSRPRCACCEAPRDWLSALHRRLRHRARGPDALHAPRALLRQAEQLARARHPRRRPADGDRALDWGLLCPAEDRPHRPGCR